MSVYMACPVPSWNPWILTSKSADQSVVNSTALVDCVDLGFGISAQSKVRVRGLIVFDTTATGDFKYTVTGPASPALVRGIIATAIPGAAMTHPIPLAAYPNSNGVALAGTGTTGGIIKLDLVIHNGANAGTVQFRFAQNTASNDSGAIVRAGSYLEIGAA